MDETPSQQDVPDDFNCMRHEFSIKSISTKWVSFGTDGVPKGEPDYLKAVYDFHGVLEAFLIKTSVQGSSDTT